MGYFIFTARRQQCNLKNKIIPYYNKNDDGYDMMVVTIISINIVTLVKSIKPCDDTVFDKWQKIASTYNIRHYNGDCDDCD